MPHQVVPQRTPAPVMNGTSKRNQKSQVHNSGNWTTGDQVQADVSDGDFASSPYLKGDLLGSGGWGRVYKVMRASDGKVFAGKFSKAKGKLREEASILRSLNHERILKFVDYFEDVANPTTTNLVMEACLGGDLQNQIDHYPQNTRRNEVLQVIRQVAEALEYLHGKNLLHTDVKPQNILIRSWTPVDVVLADCADVKTPRQVKKLMGTPAYYSPQILKTQSISSFGDDIWALGITLMGLLAQWPPVYRKRDDIKKYPRRCFDHAEEMKEMNPEHDLVGLLSRMLVWEADSRASASECLRLVNECMDRSLLDTGDNFGIKTSEGFNPISFW
ncbi:Fc.00g007980.m01.CDS01 [Cosmosporella sp. VM-42]